MSGSSILDKDKDCLIDTHLLYLVVGVFGGGPGHLLLLDLLALYLCVVRVWLYD